MKYSSRDRPSRWGVSRVRGALAMIELAGAGLLAASEFVTLFDVRTASAVVRTVSGGAQHSYGLLVIAVAAAPIALLAGAGGGDGAARRGPAACLAALGVVALIVVLVVDLPDVSSSGVVAPRYVPAQASPGAGFYLETLGALLVAFAGAALLVVSAPRRARSRRACEAP